MLTEEQVRQYREQGFCIAKHFLDSLVVTRLLEELDEVVAGATVAHHDRTKMEMEPGQEPGGTLVRRVYEPCDRYPSYQNLAETPDVLDSVQQLIGPDVVFHYSKLNMKPATIGSPVEWHQDLAYYPLTNPDSVTILFYLDDADSKTGCLRVMPGVHERRLFDHTESGFFSGRITETMDESNAIELEAPAGSAIFIQCTTPHSSRPNRSIKSRRTLILSYRAADAYPIYMGQMTVVGEAPVRLVRGQPSPSARFAFSQIAIPKYRRATSSLYDLQAEANRLSNTSN
jgi:ectoine hydroxylase-related dioxygenase (phytanoyl-CoA dioxygenase family)